MTATNVGDASTPSSDTPLRLRIQVIDALMSAKGVGTVEAQAAAFGLNRTHWFGIRSGRVMPNLNTAMKIATAAGTSVEVLFGRLP